MSPEQLFAEMESERRADVANLIVARCTGCGFGFVSFRDGLECYCCGELVERVGRAEAAA